MSEIIKGYVNNSKPFFEKGDFKMYGFCPNNEYIDKVIVNEIYNNITIKGNLPNLIEGKEYELEVEYEKKGQYESYVVKRLLNNPMDMNENEAYIFLSELIDDKLARNILDKYPDFIQKIIKGKKGEIDVDNIYGLGYKKLDMIEKKINDNIIFFKIINEFKDYDLTMSQVQKIYNTYSSFETLKKKMNENPYRCLCSIAGIGFKSADVKILNKNRSLATSPFRMAECILYNLKKNEDNGNTWISNNELYAECSKMSPQCIKEFKSVITKDNSIYYDENTKRVSRKQTYLCECDIAKRLKRIYVNPRVLDIDYSKYDNVDGIQLIEKQKLSTEYACKYNFYILSGFGGSGKTFSTKALVQMLDDEKFSYILLSPTGKASKNLSKNTNRVASTIHRGLGFNPSEGFMHNEQNKLTCDFVIVDEATMIDVYLMNNLLKAIDEDRTKLIFICDTAQIPSVGCGNCIQDLVNSKMFPTIFLDKVFRYAEGGLAKVATDTRLGHKFLNDDIIQKFGSDFVFVSTPKDTLIDKVISAYHKLLEKSEGNIDDIIVISSYNVGEFGTYKINSIIQDLMNPLNDREEISYVRQKTEIKFRINDRVMQIVNNYNAPLFTNKNQKKKDEEYTSIFNGDDGRIIEIGKNKNGVKYMVVDFYGTKVLYRGEDINNLVLGYCISSHKSQGSQYPYVITITPPPHKFFLNRNLLYVMYSRGKKFVYNIGTTDTINCALKKSENLNRKTWLCDLFCKR